MAARQRTTRSTVRVEPTSVSPLNVTYRGTPVLLTQRRTRRVNRLASIGEIVSELRAIEDNLARAPRS